MFRKNRPAFRGFVEKLSKTDDLRAIVTSHGGPITERPAEQLQESLSRL
jgi:hypothetical protein